MLKVSWPTPQGLSDQQRGAPASADFFGGIATKWVCEGSLVGWVAIYGSAPMCDYSLHAVATRPAKVAERLVSTKFQSTPTRGFASPDNPQVAVCLRPGTEIAFENDVQTRGVIFRRNIGDRLARFRQIGLNRPAQHHDALEFSNGAIVLVTDLTAGQRATVLQLPASPIEERPEAGEPAAWHETADL
jgi:hypothetical protein